MKLSTVTYPSLEMTSEEENELWDQAMRHGHEGGPKPVIEGMVVQDWDTDDGRNLILFEGEELYRQVIRIKEAQ